MGGRYWVSGVQLGMLQASPKKEVEKLVDAIIDKQFIGSKEEFEELLAEFEEDVIEEADIEVDPKDLDKMKEKLINHKIVFGCCMCGKGIQVEETNPEPEVTVIIERNGQNFWAHETCLLETMCDKSVIEVEDK